MQNIPLQRRADATAHVQPTVTGRTRAHDIRRSAIDELIPINGLSSSQFPARSTGVGRVAWRVVLR